MMTNQKHLFQLPPDLHYLNGAYMSPQMTSVEEAGIEGMRRKQNPATIRPADFFDLGETVREKFARIVHCPAAQTAIIPSTSYGLQAAIANIPPGAGTHAITIGHEYPSDYYALEEWCRLYDKTFRVIADPGAVPDRGKRWNEAILSSIDQDTAAVVISAIHWMDGLKFDLEGIGARCRDTGTVFIVDGTQAVGAMPIDVTRCRIDALVCCGYKWLLGPYSTGMAYYSERFDAGRPNEIVWMNKVNAADFTALTEYSDTYKPGAARYNVGEYGNFILLPMLGRAFDQVLALDPAEIQRYSAGLTAPLVTWLGENGYPVETEEYRVHHIFGLRLPPEKSREELLRVLEDNRIVVSVRGTSVRVSTHVYNTAEDIAALIGALRE